MGNETNYTPDKLMALMNYWIALAQDDLQAANVMLEREAMRVLGLSAGQWKEMQSMIGGSN